MFSEEDIVIHCRQCKSRCDDIKKCPLKTDWPEGRKHSAFPCIPADWKNRAPAHRTYIKAARRYSTEELISGLGRLNSHL